MHPEDDRVSTRTSPRRTASSRTARRTAARRVAVALAWVLALVLAAAAVLVLLPGPTFALLVASIIAQGAAMLLVAGAVVVALVGLLARRLGASRWLAVPGVLAIAAAGVGGYATVAQAREAGRADVDVAWSQYLLGAATTAHASVTEPAATQVYATVDGQELSADVWVPPVGGPSTGRVAVVKVHGGSWSQGARGEAPAWDSELAEQGAVVVDVDYRLTGDVDGEPWREQPADVACAVAWVGANAEQLGVDPERIVIMGDSAGAHLALLAAYAPEEFPPSCALPAVRPAGVIALYPPTELVSLQRSGGWRYPDVLPGDGVLDLMGGAAPEQDPRAYAAASPLTWVARVGAGVPRTLVVHGEADRVVPVDQSRRLVAALEQVGAERASVEAPFANHAFDQVWGAVTTQTARTAVERWLQET